MDTPIGKHERFHSIMIKSKYRFRYFPAANRSRTSRGIPGKL
jgi:hypothetical protein